MPQARLITSGDLVEQGQGIFYSPHRLPLVDERLIALLKRTAGSIERRRARFCAHPSPEDEQHDMLIASHRETYVAPHRHLDNSETLLVIEGMADLLLFDPEGGLSEVVKMGAAGSGRPFFYRMPPGQFHSLSIDSEVLVFIESTKGPFRARKSEDASWAPAPNEITKGRAFIAAFLD